MARLRVLAAMAAAAAAVTQAHGYTEHGKCTAYLGKCAGEANYEYVPYVKCCDENKYECASAPKLGWGKFCVPKDDTSYGKTPGYPKKHEYSKMPEHPEKPEYPHKPEYPEKPEPKCYENGIKCQGAPGYPYYHYMSCCDKHAKCVENHEIGWGKFCMLPEDYVHYKPKPSPSPVYKPKPSPSPEPKNDHSQYDDKKPSGPGYDTTDKCYGDNVRCMGAAGHAYYHFMSCCNPKAKCVEHKGLGWGKFCIAPEAPVYHHPKPSHSPVYMPKPSPTPVYKKDHPHYTTSMEYGSSDKCYGDNVRCMGAAGHSYYHFMPCCNPKAKCVEHSGLGWGKFCMPPKAPVYHHPKPSPSTVYKKEYPKVVYHHPKPSPSPIYKKEYPETVYHHPEPSPSPVYKKEYPETLYRHSKPSPSPVYKKEYSETVYHHPEPSPSPVYKKEYPEVVYVDPKKPEYDEPEVIVDDYKPKCMTEGEDCSDADKCCDEYECKKASWYGAKHTCELQEKLMKEKPTKKGPVKEMPTQTSCVKNMELCKLTTDCCNKDTHCGYDHLIGVEKYCLPKLN